MLVEVARIGVTPAGLYLSHSGAWYIESYTHIYTQPESIEQFT